MTLTIQLFGWTLVLLSQLLQLGALSTASGLSLLMAIRFGFSTSITVTKTANGRN